MKLAAFATALAAAAVYVPVAHAQHATQLHAGSAGQLAELCAANPRQELGDAKINYCHGFAQGAIDVIRHDAGGNKPFCFPSPTPTRAETLNGFVRWVRADSTHAGESAAGGLYRFLKERYPCGK